MSKLLTWILILPVWFLSLQQSSTGSDNAVVRAVLFYSPSCGHCHLVITESLPPLIEKYGDQLEIVGVDVSQTGGQALFLAALQHFNLESGGVPLLVVGDTYLVGSVDIPEKFPGLIDQYLAQGGVDWPPIPGFAEALESSEPNEPTPTAEITPTGAPANTASSPTQAPLVSTPTPGLLITSDQTGLMANFTRDLTGNMLAVIVLVSMILSVGGAISFFQRSPGTNASRATITGWDWLFPVLCVTGLGVAGYLAYVETAQVEAVCGPVGDCNTVQQSQYARIFGVLPIGVLGIAGYVMILLAWILGRSADHRLVVFSRLALFGMTAFGILFSIYLTFLEPFVIGATCAWCLTSAIIMTALFWLSLAPARQVLSDVYGAKRWRRRPTSTQS